MLENDLLLVAVVVECIRSSTSSRRVPHEEIITGREYKFRADRRNGTVSWSFVRRIRRNPIHALGIAFAVGMSDWIVFPIDGAA